MASVLAPREAVLSASIACVQLSCIVVLYYRVACEQGDAKFKEMTPRFAGRGRRAESMRSEAGSLDLAAA
eukprot:6177885-Pleurochrysis_carterae.AAC.1